MRGSSQSISDILTSYLRETGLEKSILETRVADLWPELMGESVARLTRSVEVENGRLIVHVDSAALKAQLFECRYQLIKRINDKLGCEVVHDCRILG